MTAPRDITGERFGLLVGIKRVGTTKRGGAIWRFACDCGICVDRPISNLRQSIATHQSCGCFKTGQLNKGRSPASKTHGMSGTRLFRVWGNMRQRCHDKKNYRWHDYGARGISVCDEWQKFEPFAEWALAHGYSDDLQIDRIDNDKGYCPENCRFVTPSENMANQRKSIRYTIHGRNMGLAEIERRYGIKRRTLVYRIELLGLTPEEAATAPRMKGGAKIKHGRYSKYAGPSQAGS